MSTRHFQIYRNLSFWNKFSDFKIMRMKWMKENIRQIWHIITLLYLNQSGKRKTVSTSLDFWSLVCFYTVQNFSSNKIRTHWIEFWKILFNSLKERTQFKGISSPSDHGGSVGSTPGGRFHSLLPAVFAFSYGYFVSRVFPCVWRNK